MSRIVALFALVALLILGGRAEAATQAPSPVRPLVVTTAAERQGDASGLPAVTYEEVVNQPRAAAGYSMESIAIGAIAGVIAANAVLPMFGYTAVSAALAGAPVTGATLEAALATSRLITVSAAAAGGVIGQWLYSGPGR